MFLGQKFWAKDVIFLITEQEQLGMQAWLKAYHGSDDLDGTSILNSGTLDARAGSIQAAINLELHGFDIEYIDVKVEGLNGQLPNLDLLNLIQRLALKEGLSSGHKQTSNRRRSGAKSSFELNLRHMISMMLTQATGVPNGNHGLFHRYGIEAVTLEAHKREQSNHQRRSQGANAMIKLIEGISRSLNNLLERFHQSFFFYLLVASDRFVSIGDYMPSLSAIAGSLLIKAFITWLQVNRKFSEENKAKDGKCVGKETRFNYSRVGKLLILSHLFGVALVFLPNFQPLDSLIFRMGIPTELYLTAVFAILSILSLFIPFVISFNSYGIEVCLIIFKTQVICWYFEYLFYIQQILHIVALLEAGTSLIIMGMLNFSLGLFLSVFIVPFAIMINPNTSKAVNR